MPTVVTVVPLAAERVGGCLGCTVESVADGHVFAERGRETVSYRSKAGGDEVEWCRRGGWAVRCVSVSCAVVRCYTIYLCQVRGVPRMRVGAFASLIDIRPGIFGSTVFCDPCVVEYCVVLPLFLGFCFLLWCCVGTIASAATRSGIYLLWHDAVLGVVWARRREAPV